MTHDDLSDFLRVRRAHLQPDEVGLPTHGRRRVPGLRREEVAILAGVSPDYYSKLEQGRGSGASDSVLEAIADVLRLNPTERVHLRRLVRHSDRPPRRAQGAPAARVRPGVRRLIESMPEVPAVVIGPAMDSLAWNDLADELFGITAMTKAGVDTPEHVFLSPEARLEYPEWEATAKEVVGYLRFSVGQTSDDTALNALVRELSAKSPEFRSMWAQQTVRDKPHGHKLFVHAVVGDLHLGYEAFRVSDDDRQVLVTYTAEAGSATESGLRHLADLAASRPEDPGNEVGSLHEHEA